MRQLVAGWLALVHPDRCDAPYDPHPDADAGSRWGTPRCDRRPHGRTVKHRRRGFFTLHRRLEW